MSEKFAKFVEQHPRKDYRPITFMEYLYPLLFEGLSDEEVEAWRLGKEIEKVDFAGVVER